MFWVYWKFFSHLGNNIVEMYSHRRILQQVKLDGNPDRPIIAAEGRHPLTPFI
jgi:hypothetical protein